MWLPLRHRTITSACSCRAIVPQAQHYLACFIFELRYYGWFRLLPQDDFETEYQKAERAKAKALRDKLAQQAAERRKSKQVRKGPVTFSWSLLEHIPFSRLVVW